MVKKLSFYIAKEDDPEYAKDTLVFSICGARPASDEELELVAEVERLEHENEQLLRRINIGNNDKQKALSEVERLEKKYADALAGIEMWQRDCAGRDASIEQLQDKNEQLRVMLTNAKKYGVHKSDCQCGQAHCTTCCITRVLEENND